MFCYSPSGNLFVFDKTAGGNTSKQDERKQTENKYFDIIIIVVRHT